VEILILGSFGLHRLNIKQRAYLTDKCLNWPLYINYFTVYQGQIWDFEEGNGLNSLNFGDLSHHKRIEN